MRVPCCLNQLDEALDKRGRHLTALAPAHGIVVNVDVACAAVRVSDFISFHSIPLQYSTFHRAPIIRVVGACLFRTQ